MKEKIQRIDSNPELKQLLLKYCRLKPGDIWVDPIKGHKVGCLDVRNFESMNKLMDGKKTKLNCSDPPYNIEVGGENTVNLSETDLETYMNFSKQWVENAIPFLDDNSSFYIWLGADQKKDYQPLPDFMIMMRNYKELQSRSFITLRNQRGYGTQKNWMSVRQECLYYTKGDPFFKVIYTDIPKILKGYYKTVDGQVVDNQTRSKSEFIRSSNVWVDCQQVFYRMHENVPGCYTQKPLKSIEKIVEASSVEGDLIVDLFAHSGTTLIAGEKLNRIVYTNDFDPIFAEITIRRLERYRMLGEEGFQERNPFPEIEIDFVSEKL
jgi:site-specific DNA-methyltransferase (adenine-specific)